MNALVDAVAKWEAMLPLGLEASGGGSEGEAFTEAIETRLRTGSPLASEAWIEQQEIAISRRLRPPPPVSRVRAKKAQKVAA